MDEIAKRVGISKRTLYENFSSKEELIEVTITSIMEKIDAKDREIAYDKSLSSIDKLRHISLVIIDEIRYIDEKAIYDVVKNYPKQNDRLSEWLINRGELQRGIIQVGVSKGELRDVNYDVLLKILNNSKTWLLDREFLIQNNLTIAEGVKSLIDIILNGVSN